MLNETIIFWKAPKIKHTKIKHPHFDRKRQNIPIYGILSNVIYMQNYIVGGLVCRDNNIHVMGCATFGSLKIIPHFKNQMNVIPCISLVPGSPL